MASSLWFVYALGSIMVGILIALGIYLIIIRSKEGEGPEDGDIILNVMNQYSDGYAVGVINKKLLGEKRIGVEFFPRGLTEKQMKKQKEEIKKQLVFFEKDKLVPFLINKGKEIYIGFPPKEEDIPEKMKGNIFGKIAVETLRNLNSSKEVEGILRKRIETQHKILEKTEGLGIVEDWVSLNDEKERQLIKNLVKEEKKFPSPYDSK